MAKKYKIAIVIPVYNVEKYLKETIDSVISQTLGFKQNIQIVLVNDGSIDHSEAICLSYKEKYPDNIIYFKQKNKGVSAACNKGITLCNAKYIAMLGSDDKLSSDACEEVYNFFEKHYDEVDFVSIKLVWFEAQTGDHVLNYRFYRDRIVNINNEPMCVQSATGGVFLKAEALRDHRFNSSLRTNEDTEFLTRLVLKKEAYGIITKPTYYYRKRYSNDSLSNSEISSADFYSNVPNESYLGLLNYSIAERGIPHKYVQCLVMYFIQWRIKVPDAPNFKKSELHKYIATIRKLLQYIDDDVILQQKYIYREQKMYALSLKYGEDILSRLELHDDKKLYYRKTQIADATKQRLRIEFIEVKDNKLVIKGIYNSFKTDTMRIHAKMGGAIYELQDVFRPYSEVYSLGEKIYTHKAFQVSLPLSNKPESLKFVTQINDKTITVSIKYWKFSGLSDIYNAYRIAGDHILLPRGKHLEIIPYARSKHVLRELKYLNTLRKESKYRLIFYRLAYHIGRLFVKKSIWLISDRPASAGDNAEYLFRYAATKKATKTLPYFAIEKSSDKYKELKSVGRVVPYHSFRFKMLFLLAEKRISSAFDQYVINDFGEDREFMHDLYNFEYIYVNHGVLASDSSRQFGKYAKNARLLTVGTKFEKNSIVSNPEYGYGIDEVVVAGLPRFDPLYSNPQRTILFMPTWRHNLATYVKKVKGTSYDKHIYGDTFKDSEYFKFYNSLMNDKRIRDKLEEYDYTIKFFIHPSFSSQWKDFDISERVHVSQPPHNYIEALKEGSLMVTDYSGVAFDFAYMRKPIIYTQYDKDKLYENHYYKQGEFSYESNGFGDVMYDFESSVNAIIKAIETDCKMPKKYEKRVDKFFYKHDHNNAKRVYEAIMAINDKGGK